MIDKRLKEAAFTSVPALGLGLTAIRAFRQLFGKKEDKILAEESSGCIRGSTKEDARVKKDAGNSVDKSRINIRVDRFPDSNNKFNDRVIGNGDNIDHNINSNKDTEQNHLDVHPPMRWSETFKRDVIGQREDDVIDVRSVTTSQAKDECNKTSAKQSDDDYCPQYHIQRLSKKVKVQQKDSSPIYGSMDDVIGMEVPNWPDEILPERKNSRWSLESTESLRFSLTSGQSWMSRESNASDNAASVITWFKTLERPTNPRRSSTESSSSTDSSTSNQMTGSHADPQTLTNKMFDFPSDLCGRLIGKQGRNVAVVKRKSGAEISVKPKVFSTKYQTVYVIGTQQQVSKAVSLIRKKFSEKKFPNVNYNRHLPDIPETTSSSSSSSPPLTSSSSSSSPSPKILQLTLPFGMQLDVSIISVVSANHLFLHQITHPTFANLHKLTLEMTHCYDLDPCVPSLHRSLEAGILCVVPMSGFWYRCQITRTYPDAQNCEIKFVDYGGYTTVQGSMLKQIRNDFMSIPFQAIECYLANLMPLNNDQDFCQEMKEALEKLVGVVGLKAEVVRLEGDGIPCVILEKHDGVETSSINRSMIDRGWAAWSDIT